MRIAVTDANIFIDLIKLDLIAHLFTIEVEIFTTSEVLEELHDHQADELYGFHQNGQLFIHALTDAQRQAVGVLKVQKSLSYADRTVILDFGRTGKPSASRIRQRVRPYCPI